MIVHASYSYPPNLGGLEKVVQQLACSQAALGHDVTVLTAGKQKSTTIEDAVTVHRLWGRTIANTTLIPGLFPRLLRIQKADIVHVHIVQAYMPEVVWLASLIRGFRYVAHIHLDTVPSGPAGILLASYKRFILARVLRSAKAVVVFTADQKAQAVKAYRLTEDKVHIIPNGVEEMFFSPHSRRPHAPLRLIFVGRLGYQKNLPALLHALDGISDKFTTTLVGDGPDRHALKTLAKNLHLGNVHFAGRLDGLALRKEYDNSDLFVLPSEREGMPLALLEAQAMGLPVIGSNVQGIRECISDTVNGILVAYNSPEALRTALLGFGNGQETYSEMSAAARAAARQYTWPKIAERFIQLYGSST